MRRFLTLLVAVTALALMVAPAGAEYFLDDFNAGDTVGNYNNTAWMSGYPVGTISQANQVMYLNTPISHSNAAISTVATFDGAGETVSVDYIWDLTSFPNRWNFAGLLLTDRTNFNEGTAADLDGIQLSYDNYMNGGELVVTTWVGGARTNVFSSTGFYPGVDFNMAIKQVDADTYKCYVDGVEIHEETFASAPVLDKIGLSSGKGSGRNGTVDP